MLKRGQVSVFVVIGLVVLVIFALVMFFYSDLLVPMQKDKDIPVQLNLKMKYIDDKIDSCVESETWKVLEKFSENGGLLESTSFVVYKGQKYPFLCFNIEESDKCLSHPLIYSSLVNGLNNYLEEAVKVCVNVQEFADEKIAVIAEDLKIDSSINKKDIVVEVDYPISLKSGMYKEENSKFLKVVKAPLGELVEIVNHILNVESSGANFNALSYSILYLGRREVFLHQPYPDKVYEVKLKESDFSFYFAIEGESRFE